MKSEILHNKIPQYMPNTTVKNKNQWRVLIWKKAKGIWRKRAIESTKELNKMRKEWTERV